MADTEGEGGMEGGKFGEGGGSSDSAPFSKVFRSVAVSTTNVMGNFKEIFQIQYD